MYLTGVLSMLARVHTTDRLEAGWIAIFSGPVKQRLQAERRTCLGHM